LRERNLSACCIIIFCAYGALWSQHFIAWAASVPVWL
jgi:hypothetical protein